MSPNNSAIFALILAVVVFLIAYYYGRVTFLAALSFAAIVGVIFQSIFLSASLSGIANLTPSQIAQQVGDTGFYALMTIVYVLVILVALILYAARDRRVITL
jgi:hypothetical protein